jgi:hypothetical protein
MRRPALQPSSAFVEMMTKVALSCHASLPSALNEFPPRAYRPPRAVMDEKAVTFRLDPELLALSRQATQADSRTLTNYVATIL